MRSLKIESRITDRSDTLNRYFNEITKNGVLSKDEECKIIELAKAGDSIAREKIIKANLKFVISVAKQYKSKNVPLEDLISQGNIGLIRAIDRFDNTKDFKFISYAVWWIRQEIIKYLTDNGSNIRIPANKKSTINKVNNIISSCYALEGRPASEVEIADQLEMTVDDVRDILNINEIHDFHYNQLEDYELEDNNEIVDQFKNAELEYVIKILFKKLSSREKFILINYFGIACTPLSIVEISELIGLSAERTRQLKNNILQKIRFKIARKKSTGKSLKLVY